MGTTLTSVQETQDHQELSNLLPSVSARPWEDAEQYEALRRAVLDQLKPSTLHEKSIALRIAEVHWDHYRSQELARDVWVTAYRKATIELLNGAMGCVGPGLFPDPRLAATARDLVSSDPAARNKALQELESRGVSEAQIRAEAYLSHMSAIETLEKRPTRLDERRRALMKEFEDLKMINKLDQVPDAEVLQDHANS